MQSHQLDFLNSYSTSELLFLLCKVNEKLMTKQEKFLKQKKREASELKQMFKTDFDLKCLKSLLEESNSINKQIFSILDKLENKIPEKG